MIYNDDEPLVELPTVPAGEKPPVLEAGKTQALLYYMVDKPFEATELKVLVELMGSGKIEERYPVDLVTVLDVSGSMKGNKIENLKIAMQFLIRKLSPIDRLSVVTFDSKSKRLFPLRQITEKSQDEIIKVINDLQAHYQTNTAAGLKEGIKVLMDRHISEDRVGAIILMSDGEQNIGDARLVDHIDEFPIHTFGFGQGFESEKFLGRKFVIDPNFLTGGTFADVRNENNLGKSFSLCLGGLLTVVVKDLKLTITHFEEESEIKDVFAGNYPQTKNPDRTVTISFGELYNKEVRKVLLNLLLPKVDPPKEKSIDVLQVTYTHSAGEKKPPYEAPPITATINRTSKATGKEIPEVTLEFNRLNTVKSVREATAMAEEKKMEEARDKVTEAKRSLEGVKVEDPNQLIKALIDELQQILEFMISYEEYENKGRSYVSSFLTSHDRMRPAARGDLSKPLPFLTPRMTEYLKQAEEFEKDTSKPPPTEAEDREKDRTARVAEEERIAEEKEKEKEKENNQTNVANPGALRNFIMSAIQALISIYDMLKRITGRT